MLSVTQGAVGEMHEGGSLVFTFIGHGRQDRLMPADCGPKGPFFSLSADLLGPVQERAAVSGAFEVLVVGDTCRRLLNGEEKAWEGERASRKKSARRLLPAIAALRNDYSTDARQHDEARFADFAPQDPSGAQILLAFSSGATMKSKDGLYLRALSEALERPVSLAKRLALTKQVVERRTNFKQTPEVIELTFPRGRVVSSGLDSAPPGQGAPGRPRPGPRPDAPGRQAKRTAMTAPEKERPPRLPAAAVPRPPRRPRTEEMKLPRLV